MAHALYVGIRRLMMMMMMTMMMMKQHTHITTQA
jgi:hypothetical protein